MTWGYTFTSPQILILKSTKIVIQWLLCICGVYEEWNFPMTKAFGIGRCIMDHWWDRLGIQTMESNLQYKAL